MMLPRVLKGDPVETRGIGQVDHPVYEIQKLLESSPKQLGHLPGSSEARGPFLSLRSSQSQWERNTTPQKDRARQWVLLATVSKLDGLFQ